MELQPLEGAESGGEGNVYARPRASISPYWKILTSASSILSVILLVIIAIILAPKSANHTTPSVPPSCDFSLPTEDINFPRHDTLLLKNGTIHFGDGTIGDGYDIFLQDGKVSAFGKTLSVSADMVLELSGAVVTPGLIDLHSHMGVNAWPEDMHGTGDVNEDTNPNTVMVRAFDAFDSMDNAIPWVRSGGVTTIQVLPGSANVIGGEGALVKLRDTADVSQMRIRNAPPLMKMASGENPKNVYGRRDELPASRMGSAWVLRRTIEAAQKLKYEQDDWCEAGKKGRMPSDLSLQPLVRLLRNQTVLNIHSYEVRDMETHIRVSKEFNYRIASFHHAAEAWMIPDVLKQEGITVATFPDSGMFKMEAYDFSVHAPRILSDANVQTCLKSDHPVLDSHYLMNEAAISHHYGMSESAALRSVTSVPAKALRMDHRIGSIQEGKEADVVVWDRHPLRFGARPNLVVVEGKILSGDPNSRQLRGPSSNYQKNSAPLNVNGQSVTKSNVVENLSGKSVGIRRVTIYSMMTTSAESFVGSILIENGTVKCVAVDCPAGADVNYELQRGIVVPGFIVTDSGVGMFDIDQEERTHDGVASGEMTTFVSAADGVVLKARHVRAAFASGVTTAIASPEGSFIINGLSTAFRTQGGSEVDGSQSLSDALVKDVIGLRVTISQNGKVWGGALGSISGQIAYLRKQFRSAGCSGNVSLSSESLCAVLNGSLPLIAAADNTAAISALIRLKAELNIPRLVLLGAQEAAVLAADLAAAQIPVIVSPVRCAPQRLFESQQCRDDRIAQLARKGVKVLISEDTNEFTRDLRWSAGWATEFGLSYTDALAAISSNVADVFALPDGSGRIKVGTSANLLLFDGNPLTFEGRIRLIVTGNRHESNPQQR